MLPPNIDKTLDAAERSQGLLKSDLATGIIIILLGFCIILGLWAWTATRANTKLTREVVGAVERNTASSVILTQAVNGLGESYRDGLSELARAIGDLKRPAPRRRNTGEVALGPEPNSQVTQVVPKKGEDEKG